MRCRRRGCLELPVHGRRSGRALWCELHYVSQDAHQPKRCPVLQQHASGDFLACWRETTWGWPGQPPTRCERHKAIGHQQQNLDEVVSVLKGIFTEVTVHVQRLASFFRCGGRGRNNSNNSDRACQPDRRGKEDLIAVFVVVMG